MKKILVITASLLGVIFAAAACTFSFDPADPNYVPVEAINGVPTGGVRNFALVLARSVSPGNATNKAVTWAIKNDGGTNSTLTRNVLTPMASGTVTVTATVKNGGKTRAQDYVEDFEIEIFDTFYPVTNIINVPAAGTAGESLTLTGTVRPSNATNKTITWEVLNAGTAGAIIDGDVLKTIAAGTVVVQATVQHGKTPSADYVKDFAITVTGTFVAVDEIVNGPENFVVGASDLFATVEPANASFKDIVWTVKSAGTTGAVITGSTLTTTAMGTAVLTATIINGSGIHDYTQDFTVTVIDVASSIAVTNITGVPDSTEARVPLALTGTVVPSNATFKQIEWSVVNAGTTGADIAEGSLTTTKRGTVTVRATIKNGKGAAGDYTQDFTVGVKGLAVYVAGCFYDDGNSHWDRPCYWEIDGDTTTRHDLPTQESGDISRATAVATAADGTVYISGFYNGLDDGTGYTCYWTIPANGSPATRTDLSYGTAKAIAVSGNDVYVAGTDDNGIPCYWKNGTKTTLAESPNVNLGNWGNSYTISAIVANGTSVYVSGYYGWVPTTVSVSEACYWDHAGALHTLDKGTAPRSKTSGIAIMDSDVYIVGTTEINDDYWGSVSLPCYWKNGTLSNMTQPEGAEYSFANAIAIEGADWHVAGSYYNNDDFLCYWKNGVPQTMNIRGEAKAITTLNGNVYIAGYAYINNSYIPSYWVDGERKALGLYTDGYGDRAAVGIAVVDDR